MQTGNVFIVHPSTPDQISALTAFIKALKIKFEVRGEDTYNPEFIAKIKRSELEFEEGSYTTVEEKNLNDYIDNL